MQGQKLSPFCEGVYLLRLMASADLFFFIFMLYFCHKFCMQIHESCISAKRENQLLFFKKHRQARSQQISSNPSQPNQKQQRPRTEVLSIHQTKIKNSQFKQISELITNPQEQLCKTNAQMQWCREEGWGLLRVTGTGGGVGFDPHRDENC